MDSRVQQLKSWLQRIPYQRKFSIISILFLLPMLVVLLFFFSALNRQIAAVNQQRNGNQYIAVLHNLLDHTIEHELLAYDYINGNQDASANLINTQAKIQTDLNSLAELEEQFGPQLQTNAVYSQLTSVWQNLQDTILTSDFNRSEQMHHTLIETIRTAIDHVGDTSGLILPSSFENAYLTDLVLTKLPANHTMLGETLLIGLRSIVNGRTAPEARARLIALNELLSMNLDAVQTNVNLIWRNNQTQAVTVDLRTPVQSALEEITSFVGLTRNNLLIPPVPQISGADFRASAVEALRSNAILWADTNNILDTLLQRRAASLQAHRLLVSGLTLLLLLLIGGLWLALYRSTQRGLRQLQQVGATIAAGQPVALATPPSADEFGALASTLGSGANQLISTAKAQASVIETYGAPLITVSTDDLITLMNPAAAALFQVDSAASSGQPIQRIIPALELDHMPRAQQLQGRRASGELFPISVTCRRNEQADTPVWVLSVRDETLQRQMTQELQAVQAVVEQERTMWADFLTTLGHEIRPAMEDATRLTETLLQTKLTAQQREHIKTLRQVNLTLSTWVNDILDLALLEADQLQLDQHPFDLYECAEQAISAVALSPAAQTLELALKIDWSLPVQVIGDKQRLYQTLLNLLTIIVRKLSAGQVGMYISGRSLQQPIYELTFSFEISASIEQREQLADLRESLQSSGAAVQPARQNIALGVVLSQGLIEAMGGTLSVSGDGSLLSVSFSIEASATAVPARAYTQRNQPNLRTKRCLVINAQPLTREAISHLCTHWGISVAYTQLERALTLLDQAEPFDLLMLEAQAYDLEQTRIIHALRSHPHTHTSTWLALTGPDQASSPAFEGLRALSKPLKATQLYQCLTELWSETPRERAASTSHASPSTSHDALQPLRILIVEDNPVNQKVTQQMLQKIGYRADIATNGRVALDMLHQQRYDIVLMDLQMPEMDGKEATRQIVNTWLPSERPRIIAITASANPNDREECLALGMDDYMTKPVRLGDLRACLQHWAQTLHQPTLTPAPTSSADPHA